MNLKRLLIVGFVFSSFQLAVSMLWINQGKPFIRSLLYALISGFMYMLFMWLLARRKNKQEGI